MAEGKNARPRSSRRGWLASLSALTLALLVGGGTRAWGQAPAPRPSAAPPHAAAPRASAAAPAASAPHGDSPHGDSPHGDSPHGDSPHGDSPHGDSPHGHMGMGHEGGRGMAFEPPPDGADADPSLPPGTIVVSIRNADDIPLAGVDMTLGILHTSVARGESRERKTGTTDASGSITFSNLAFGAGHAYRVSSSVGPGTFELEPFSLTDKSGMRAVLHLYEVTEDVSRVRVAMRSTVSMSLKEDNIVIDETFNIFNVSPAAWQADIEIPLPAGFKAFNTAEDMAMGALKVQPTDKGAVLRGTIPPGQSDIAFRFDVPLSGDESQDLELAMFPHTLQAQVAVEASKKMHLTAEGFPPAQFTHTQDGRSFLYTTHGLQAGPLDHFRATIGGLPTRGPGGYIAVVLALVAIGSAGIYRAVRHGRTDVPDDKYADLVEARETLIEEIAELERAHAAGTVGPKTFGRARTLLTDALARIMLQLEQADASRSRSGGTPRGPSSGGSSRRSPSPGDVSGGDGARSKKRPPAEASA